MTICIAARCDSGNACVVAADRQMTAPAMSLEFEHAESKIEALGGCLVLSSGDALLAAQVIERTKELIGTSSLEVLQVAERLRDTFMATHVQRAEHVILHPRGYSFREFKERGAAQIPPQVYIQIDNQLFNFGIGVLEFLVAGLDSKGAHIFRVHYSGMVGGDWLEYCDRLGYRAIGSGQLHAAVSLAMEGQHSGLSVAETLYNVYCAKRNAEVAPGVGTATDVAVMTPTRIERLSQETIEKLAALREKNRQNKPGKSELEVL